MKSKLDVLNEVVQKHTKSMFRYWPEFFVRNIGNSDSNVQDMIEDAMEEYASVSVEEVKKYYGKLLKDYKEIDSIRKNLDSDFISADQARLVANSIKNEKWEKQLFLIMEDIKQTAKSGSCSTSVNDVAPVVSNKLEEMGYKVKYYSCNSSNDPRETSYWTISWEK